MRTILLPSDADVSYRVSIFNRVWVRNDHVADLLADLGPDLGFLPTHFFQMPYDVIEKWMITYILLFGCHTLLNQRSCRFVVESFVIL